MHLHSSNADMEKIYTERVPKSSLASDFGGDGKSLEEYNKQLYDDFIDAREFYIMECKQAKYELDE
jgi:hypothetical protein